MILGETNTIHESHIDKASVFMGRMLYNQDVLLLEHGLSRFYGDQVIRPQGVDQLVLLQRFIF